MTRHRRCIARRALAAAAAVFAAGAAAPQAAAEPRLSDAVNVFVGGVGYPNYRTPTITAMPDGSLVAVAEGRTFDDPGFGGDLDIVSKRSTDGGLTWGSMQVIDAWAGGTNSNPTTVLDRTTNRLFLLYNRWEGNHGTTDSLPGTTHNTAWMRYSDDGGASWSNAADITAGVKDFNNWNVVSFGPGSGIQASNGRLIIPSARWVNGWQPYAAYSNDHGATWSRGALVPGGNLAGENQLVQLADGRILLEARPNISGPNTRLQSTSANGGLTWSAMASGQTGPESQMAIERFTLASAGDDRNRLVFTGPKGPERQDLVIRASYDEAQNWVNERLLYDGYSGYSDITIFPDKSIGVFFETNEARSMTFVKLNREWIEPPQRLKAFEGFRYNTPTLQNKNGGLLWNAGWSGSPATLTGTPDARIEQADLQYSNFPFAIEGKRRVYFQQGGSMARPLPSSINLNSNQTYYLSMLLRQDTLNVVENESDSEALDVLLYAGGARQASFGVRGNESFYVDVPGFAASTVANRMDKDSVYYLVAKIVAHDAASGLNDQLYLKAFKTGDPVPATDSTLGWTLATTAGFNSASIIDRLAIKGGALSDWLVDEFRFGTSFGSVVSNVLAYTWDVNASGNWSVSTNWLDGSPNVAGVTATFGNVITAPRVVTIDAPRTVGAMEFSGSNSYTLAGSAITMSAAASTAVASINVAEGDHEISVPLLLTSPTTITIATNAGLKLSGSVGGGKVDSITVATGGTLDLTDNTIVVDTGSVGTASGGVYSGLSGAIQSGRLMSSEPEAASGLTALAIARADDVGRAGGTFRGISVGSDDVLIMYTYAGDANLDGLISGDDYSSIDFAIATPGASGWVNGDFNYDGIISGDDYATIDFNIVAQGAPYPTGSVVVNTTPVPEPASFGFAAALAVAARIGARRRRRQPDRS